MPRSPAWRPAPTGSGSSTPSIVVIIGGLGSIKGAAAGSLLYGLVVAFSPAYLPSDYTFYSIILTFVLLAVVLAVRPNGLFGRPNERRGDADRLAPIGQRASRPWPC